MGRRGPKPQPASVKEAKGNPGRRPIGSDQVAAAPAADSTVKPPKWLKGEGLRLWKQHAPGLIARRLLTQTDAPPFARYCRNFARWLKMQQMVDDEGETYVSTSNHGELKRAHPAFLMAERIERTLLAIEDRFGINPAERQRIFAARAASSAQPDMFGAGAPAPSKPAPAAGEPETPPAPATPPASPIGFLQ